MKSLVCFQLPLDPAVPRLIPYAAVSLTLEGFVNGLLLYFWLSFLPSFLFTPSHPALLKPRIVI